MQKLIKSFFAIIWSIVVISAGALPFFYQIIHSQSIQFMGEKFSFAHVEWNIHKTRISLLINDIYNDSRSIHIDQLRHSCNIATFVFTKNPMQSVISIGKVHIKTDRSIGDIMSHLTQCTTSPKSIPLGKAAIENIALTCANHQITLSNIVINRNLKLTVTGVVESQGIHGVVSIAKGFSQQIRADIAWSIPKQCPLANNIPPLKHILAEKSLTGKTSLKVGPKTWSCTSRFTHDHSQFLMKLGHQRPITLTSPELSLSQIDRLTNQAISRITRRESWELRELTAKKCRVIIPVSDQGIAVNKAEAFFKIENGVVFVKNIATIHNIQGTLSYNPKTSWAVDVSHGVTDSGFVITGKLNNQKAHFDLKAPAQAVIDIFCNLNIFNSTLLTQAQGDVTGKLEFPTYAMPQWSHHVKGAFNIDGGSLHINIPGIPTPLATQNVKAFVSFANALCHVEGVCSWDRTHTNVVIQQSRHEDQGISLLDINVDLQPLTHKGIQKILPLLPIANGSGPAHIHITRSHTPHQGTHFTIMAKSARLQTPYNLHLNVFKKPFAIEEWSVIALFSKGTWYLRSIAFSGPDSQANLSGKIDSQRTSLQVKPSLIAGVPGIQGSWVITKNHNTLNAYIPKLTLENIELLRQQSDTSRSLSAKIRIDQFCGAKFTGHLPNLNVSIQKSGSHRTLNAIINEKGTHPLNLSITWRSGQCSQWSIQGNSSQALLTFLGLKNQKFSIQKFIVQAKRQTGDKFAIEGSFDDVDVVYQKKSVLEALFSRIKDISFHKVSLVASLQNQVVTLENLACEGASISVFSTDGLLDLQNGKLQIKCRACINQQEKRGVAALPPKLAKMMYGDRQIQSHIAWHFTIEEAFQPLQYPNF